MTALLAQAARHGRLLLVLGLLAGIALPDLALAMKPWLQELVALLLFLAALRVGPERLGGGLRAGQRTLGLILTYQVALPLLATLLCLWLGVTQHPLAMAAILMLSASSISGSPNLAILSGADPAPAFRLLIFGTALLPLTVIPVFHLMPGFGAGVAVLWSAARLLAVIAVAALAAYALRKSGLVRGDPATLTALDGLSAIAMAVIVVGLMSAVGPALLDNPAGLLGWLAFACALNFGAQITAALILRHSPLPAPDLPATDLPALSIVAGNRNIALFLVALPPQVTDPLLIFIGCYQIPMYTTPLVLRGFYTWLKRPLV
jgi:arsenite transporter